MADPFKEKSDMCMIERLSALPQPLENGDSLRPYFFKGYVGGFPTTAPLKFETTVKQQDCGTLRDYHSCDLTKNDEGEFNRCRELILTSFVQDEISTPETAFNVFWKIPRERQISFLLLNYNPFSFFYSSGHEKTRISDLIHDKFFEGEGVKTTDVTKLIIDAFHRKMEGMPYEEWSVLSLSGVLYLTNEESNEDAGRFCASKTDGFSSEICDADLDDLPDANDPFPLRPHKIPEGSLEGVWNGQKMVAGAGYYLCIREVDPVKKGAAGSLLSVTEFVDDRTKPHYSTTAKFYFLPEHEGIREQTANFEKRAGKAMRDAKLTIGQYPVELEPVFVDNPLSATHVVFVTKISKCTHGYFFRLLFPGYNTQFLSLDVTKPIIVHEMGGHLMYGLDDRYVPHGGGEWFEPRAALNTTHLVLHGASLIAAPCLRSNVMGGATSGNLCDSEGTSDDLQQCPIKDPQGNIAGYSNQDNLPISDVAASMAMTTVMPCPSAERPSFVDKFAGVAVLHTLFAEFDDAVEVAKHYTKLGGSDNSAMPIYLSLLLNGLKTDNWDLFKIRYSEIFHYYVVLAREYNFTKMDQDYLMGIARGEKFIASHAFDFAFAQNINTIFFKEEKFDRGFKAKSFEKLPKPLDTFAYFLLYAIPNHYPAGALESIYAHQHGGSWFSRFDAIRGEHVDVDMESITQTLLMLKECNTEFSMHTALQFLTAFAEIPEDQYESKYKKDSEVFFNKAMDLYDSLPYSICFNNRQVFTIIFGRALGVMGYPYKNAFQSRLNDLQSMQQRDL